MSCSCREREIFGIPCTHAMAAISHSRMNSENFVHPYYSKQKYLMANGGIIHPILDHTMWTLIDEEPLQPPPLKRLVRRPKNSKKRAAHEPPAGTRGHVREVQSGVAEEVLHLTNEVDLWADEVAFHVADAWVLHLTKDADLWAEEATLYLADEALHLGEAGAVHLIFQVEEVDEALHLREAEVEEALYL
ncbi:hypothetical protein ACSBR2_031537 [Camellia fascicularis]